MLPIPIPRCQVNIRPGTMSDLPFMDSLQKMHRHMVGFLHTQAVKQKIEAGQVLIAEEVNGHSSRVTGQGEESAGVRLAPSLTSDKGPVTNDSRLGYIIAQDQYAGRDDVGIIYQLNVLPLHQRGLIGAALVKEALARAAYGCRLFGCWCAQDIQANWFWESIGFLPLAFRTGSRSKQRTHIYWQRRVRQEDQSTPYWFPFQTGAGALNEDRLVVPIPAGAHWRDPMPVLLPSQQQGSGVGGEGSDKKALPPTRPTPPTVSASQKLAIIRSQSKHLRGIPAGKAAVVTGGGMRYIERGDYEPEIVAPKPKRVPRPRVKHDAKQIQAARELRDRYLEEVNSARYLPQACCKYDVSRMQIEHAPDASTDRPLLATCIAA